MPNIIQALNNQLLSNYAYLLYISNIYIHSQQASKNMNKNCLIMEQIVVVLIPSLLKKMYLTKFDTVNIINDSGCVFSNLLVESKSLMVCITSFNLRILTVVGPSNWKSQCSLVHLWIVTVSKLLKQRFFLLQYIFKFHC